MRVEDELRRVFREVDDDATPDVWPAVLASLGPRRRARGPLFAMSAVAVAAVIVIAVVGVGMSARTPPVGPAGPSTSMSSAPSPEGRPSATESTSPATTAVGQTGGDRLPLATSSPGGTGGDALATGTLGGEVRNGVACLWLVSTHESHVRVALVWPYGFTALGGPVSVIGPDGQHLAQVGDAVALGGGGTPPGFTPSAAQDPCATGQVFFVASVSSVNGKAVDIGEGSLRLVTRQLGDLGACPDSVLGPLLLVMSDGSLHLRLGADGTDLDVTWPAGFTAMPGNRITATDGSGRVVMTQGVEVTDARGVRSGNQIAICGFGSTTYP